MTLAHLVFVFVALTMNAANTVEDSQALRVNTLAQCQKLKTTYDAIHADENADMPPSFKVRWSSACIPMVLNEKHWRV